MQAPRLSLSPTQRLVWQQSAAASGRTASRVWVGNFLNHLHVDTNLTVTKTPVEENITNKYPLKKVWLAVLSADVSPSCSARSCCLATEEEQHATSLDARPARPMTKFNNDEEPRAQAFDEHEGQR